MKAQTFQKIGMMAKRKNLEINPNHLVVIDLPTKVKADKKGVAALDTAHVLFQTTLVESNYKFAVPSALVSRVYRLLSKELGVDPDAPLQEVEVPKDEEEKETEEEDAEDDDQGDKRGVASPRGQMRATRS